MLEDINFYVFAVYGHGNRKTISVSHNIVKCLFVSFSHVLRFLKM